MPDLEGWIRRPVSKVLAVGPTGAPLELLEAARAHFAGRAEVTVSHPEFLEFLAPGVSKGQAVRWLARRLGIPLEQTLAIGDQYNDLEMIAAAGHGVAMPSAPPAVRPPLAMSRRRWPTRARRRSSSCWSSPVAPLRATSGGSNRAARPVCDDRPILPDDAVGRAAAIAALRAGELVAMPTDTVYGLGCGARRPGRPRPAVRRQGRGRSTGGSSCCWPTTIRLTTWACSTLRRTCWQPRSGPAV